ncbi:hypothetical protein [Amycolatopsis sp. SID8362]|uniref:hypothetical protein n=1 Tax=Amycolatopsis sp. SID8362 TaxID=2690346 RepID=UPI001368045B|nr:hypothetical protein [Amycolatopsis sp. SID8362]NBH10192.1 hypothetical protein [Amycolatopsis sp. SID8362]NED46887.1 hypothetical protein [Amycolatopsis sp. SID8362]
MAGIAMRIGVVFAVLGFGSLILEQFDYEFRLIAWASDMQPWFGIALGVVGLALCGISVLAGRAKAAPPQPAAPQQQYPQQPGQPG